MQEKTTKYKDLNITIRTSLRANNIRITIDPKIGVVLVVPLKVPLAVGMDFVRKKESWIRTKLSKLQKKNIINTQFLDYSNFSTRYHRLKISKHEKNLLSTRISQGVIEFYYPSHQNVTHPKIQEAIKSAIIKCLKIEAQMILPKKVEKLSKKCNLRYSKLSFGHASTRWGSCSVHNALRLNVHLMRLPDRLIDYVILHELVHTAEKNHQTPFWDKLCSILPEAKNLDKELKMYSPTI